MFTGRFYVLVHPTSLYASYLEEHAHRDSNPGCHFEEVVSLAS